jgi:hypothetical protein
MLTKYLNDAFENNEEDYDAYNYIYLFKFKTLNKGVNFLQNHSYKGKSLYALLEKYRVPQTIDGIYIMDHSFDDIILFDADLVFIRSEYEYPEDYDEEWIHEYPEELTDEMLEILEFNRKIRDELVEIGKEDADEEFEYTTPTQYLYELISYMQDKHLLSLRALRKLKSSVMSMIDNYPQKSDVLRELLSRIMLEERNIKKMTDDTYISLVSDYEKIRKRN